MIFNRKPPEWRNVGAEPPEDLKSGGFQAGYKPPAAYFNWFFNRVSECLTELQSAVSGIGQKVDTTGRVLIGPDSTSLNNLDTLFVVDGLLPVPTPFEGASYSNMVFSENPPSDALNWAQTGLGIRAVLDSENNIVDGKLVVSEKVDSDASFFAQINKSE